MSCYRMFANEQQAKIIGAYYAGVVSDHCIAYQPEELKDPYEEMMQTLGKDLPPFGWDLRQSPYDHKRVVIIPGPQKDQGNPPKSIGKIPRPLTQEGTSASERTVVLRKLEKVPNLEVSQLMVQRKLCSDCNGTAGRKKLVRKILPRPQ